MEDLHVKMTLLLGSEVFSVKRSDGTLSDQLVLMKEQSLSILKEFITKHNVPSDVPDETVEISSEDDDDNEVGEKPPERSRKSK